MAEVRLEKICKLFDDVVAVDDFNLSIQDKEFVVLVGPSGCGKTTTLRMIAGLESITSGDVYIGDRLINKLPAKDRNIAMVFQNYALYPHMTVFDNMAFSLEMRKRSKDEIKERVQEAAEILGIEGLLLRRPKQLSGGQRQRVALGRAIVRKPGVFLFDEPLSNLDAKLRVQTRLELKKLHERLATTAVYVTHDQIEAMTLADRIVIMNEGVIMQTGNPMEVYDNPKNLFVAGFIGSQATNFLNVRIYGEKGRLHAKSNNFKLTIPDSLYDRFVKAKNRKVILGIRPEHIYDKEIKGAFQEGETLKVTIDVVEPIGSEIILLASCGSDQMTARVDPQTRAKPQAEMEFLLDMSRTHIFDKVTKEAY